MAGRPSCLGDFHGSTATTLPVNSGAVGGALGLARAWAWIGLLTALATATDGRGGSPSSPPASHWASIVSPYGAGRSTPPTGVTRAGIGGRFGAGHTNHRSARSLSPYGSGVS